MHYNGLGYQVLPLFPTTTTRRRQIKGEKTLSLIFEIEYCKYRLRLRYWDLLSQ